MNSHLEAIVNLLEDISKAGFKSKSDMYAYNCITKVLKLLDIEDDESLATLNEILTDRKSLNNLNTFRQEKLN